MEKYTFEQIINERIRMCDELDRMTNEFNSLVESNSDKYEFICTRTLFGGYDRQIGLYYNYSNKLENSIHRLGLAFEFGELPSSKTLMPPNHIIFKEKDIENLKSEYTDKNGEPALIIKDVEKFKEMYYAFYESEIMKQELGLEAHGNDINDGKVNLDMDYLFTTFENDYSEAKVCGNASIAFSGFKSNLPKILDMYKNCEFDGSIFNDYFKENMDANKSKDYSLVLSDKYIVKPYTPGLRGRTEEGFEFHRDELGKKLILTKTRHY